MDIKDAEDLDCPLSPIDVCQLNHRLEKIEGKIVELEKTAQMVGEIHQTVVKGSSYLNGIKHGGTAMLMVIVVFIMGLISLLTGKISFSDFLKIVG